MDQNEAIKLAQGYLSVVAEKYSIEEAILFGSFAKGTQHVDSDIDLAIVFPKVDDLFELQVELMQLRTNQELVIEPHPFALSDFDISDPVVNEILKNGVRLETTVA
jgi:predicted nucleotidyltransferase